MMNNLKINKIMKKNKNKNKMNNKLLSRVKINEFVFSQISILKADLFHTRLFPDDWCNKKNCQIFDMNVLNKIPAAYSPYLT